MSELTLAERILISTLYGADQSCVSNLPEPQKFFMHKHLYLFCTHLDSNGDGVLSWDDFMLISDRLLELANDRYIDAIEWEERYSEWWEDVKEAMDYNNDGLVEFDEWMHQFKFMAKTLKCFDDLPDFSRDCVVDMFNAMDANKDSLITLEDYRKYLVAFELDASRTEDCFHFMLNEYDIRRGNSINLARFKHLLFEFYTSYDPTSQGKFIFGPYDSMSLTMLHARTRRH